jgi:hypothetical protein
MAMARDRRTNQTPIPDEIKKLLNSRQLAAFHQSIYFGWRLGFVRRPLFQEPVFVVYNSDHDLIGILDSDGHINTDVALDIRSTESQQEQPESAPWREKRKGATFSRGNIDLLLNQKQLSTLQKIEKFGWQLNFVRQPLLKQPVAVIISPKGDRLATLELDGRIKVLSDSNVRKDIAAEQDGSEQSEMLSVDREAV